MITYIVCTKGISKSGRPYYLTKVVTPLSEQAVFSTELVLTLTGMTAEQLVNAEEGVLAQFELKKIEKEDKK